MRRPLLGLCIGIFVLEFGNELSVVGTMIR